MGHQAYYLALAYRILPAKMLNADEQAESHLLFEDDCRLNITEKTGVLEQRVERFGDAPLAMLGFYGVGMGRRRKWTSSFVSSGGSLNTTMVPVLKEGVDKPKPYQQLLLYTQNPHGFVLQGLESPIKHPT